MIKVYSSVLAFLLIVQTLTASSLSCATKCGPFASSLSFAKPSSHPTMPVSVADLAGHNYAGSFNIPMLGKQVFNFEFSDDRDQNTIRMCAHGPVENGEGVVGYTLDEETGTMSLYSIDTKEKQKKKQLERIIYNKAEDMVTMVFRIPMTRREGYIHLHRNSEVQ